MSVNPLGSNPLSSTLLKNQEAQEESAQAIPFSYAANISNQSATIALNHVAAKSIRSSNSQQAQAVNNNNQESIEPFVVKVSVQDLGEERWSSKIDPQEITRQTYIKAAVQMGLSDEQARKFANEYGVDNPFVVDSGKIREMKRSDLDNQAIVYKNTDDWGKYQSKTSESLLIAIQNYKDRLKEAETNQGATPILIAGTTTVMPSQPISLELPKVVPAVTKAAPVLAEAAVPAAMLGAGVAGQGKVLYDWGQIEYARQAANAKTNVMPLPPPPVITANPTDIKTPVVPDTSIPTEEELPKGGLTKVGPVTTSAPSTPTTSNTTPPSGPGQPKGDPTKIIPPIIAATTGTTVGVLANKLLQPDASRTMPSKPQGEGVISGIRKTGPQNPQTQGQIENARGVQRENESAAALEHTGYVGQIHPPTPKNRKTKPDFLIEGKYFDNYAPTTANPRNIASEIKKKVDDQASRIVLNLSDSAIKLEDLRDQLTKYPIPGLEEIILIKDEQVIHFFPAN